MGISTEGMTMSQGIQPASGLREFWRTWGWWWLLIIVSLGCVVRVLSLPPSEHMIGLRRVCDGAIKMLFTSHDLAEIERSNVLIKNLDCDVGRRIGPDGAFHPTASQEY
jgi:hypothetical protein